MEKVWQITDLNIYNHIDDEDNELPNTIGSIHWKLTVTNTEGNSLSSTGSAILSRPTTETSFVNIEDITQETVENWLFASFGETGKQEIEDSLVAKLNTNSAITKPSWLEALENA